MTRKKYESKGHKFENKVKKILKSVLSKKYDIIRGTSGRNKVLKKVQKEPDFLVIKKNFKRVQPEDIKIAIECKYISDSSKQARYWTMFSRGYTLLNYLKFMYPNVKCYLVFNKKNDDSMNYPNFCKVGKITFIDKMRNLNQIKEFTK